MSTLLVLRHLTVENANAIAGHTWGFPAISNFLGFTHALSRKTEAELGLRLEGCGVICHKSQVHAYQPSGWGDWVFALTRNPPYMKKQAAQLNSKGTPPSFIEEGRMHLDISLIIQVNGYVPSSHEQRQILKKNIFDLIQVMRLAGGTICGLKSVELLSAPYDEDEQERFTRGLMRRLLPGFALVSRADTLADHATESQSEALDAWLDFVALKYQAESSAASPAHGKVEWQQIPKPALGWLVPITIGYRGISKLHPPGSVSNTRDLTTPFRFVESVYSLGQWLSPHRITQLEALFWHYQSDPENGWYLCTNEYQPPEEPDASFLNTPA